MPKSKSAGSTAGPTARIRTFWRCRACRVSSDLQTFSEGGSCRSCGGGLEEATEPVLEPTRESFAQAIRGDEAKLEAYRQDIRSYELRVTSMTADMVTGGDPFKPLLDRLSDVVAQRVFGTHMAAANRWGGLLGFGSGDVPGLPSSAYEGGPVVTEGQKPAFEAAELV